VFEKATRKKLRFYTTQGTLSVEDLWDLSLEDLDSLYCQLSQEKKETETEGLLESSKVDKTLQLRMDLVKHVFNYKQAAAEANARRLATRQRNQRILALIEQKGDEELAAKSVEELQALIGQSEDDEDND
jgi:hypothetical protein